MSFLPFHVTSIQKYSESWFINNITNWRELVFLEILLFHTKHSYFGSCFSIPYFWSNLKLVLFLTIIMETVIFIVWRLCPFLSFFLPGAENASFKYTSKLHTIEIEKFPPSLKYLNQGRNSVKWSQNLFMRISSIVSLDGIFRTNTFPIWIKNVHCNSNLGCLKLLVLFG